MGFDFFNTSSLAFGSKLTTAFNQLEKLKNEALLNLEQVLKDQEVYNQYIGRNYQVPVPSTGDNPCRVDEVFQIIDAPFIVKDMKYENGQFYVSIVTFNSDTLRITVATGITDMKEGSAYYRQAISNISTGREIEFVSKTTTTSGQKLFDFRIDKDGFICLENISDYIQASDYANYSSLSHGGAVTFPYTATDYECIIAVGNQGSADIKLNGTTILGYWGADYSKRFVVVYMKKGDVLTGASWGLRVKYNVK